MRVTSVIKPIQSTTDETRVVFPPSDTYEKASNLFFFDKRQHSRA